MGKKNLKDLYNTFDLDENATKEEIKKAYRQKCKKAHPDLGGNAEEFKKISLAYEILMDDDKKFAYESGIELKKDIKQEAINYILQEYTQIILNTPHDKLLYTNLLKHIDKDISIKLNEINKLSRKTKKTIKKLLDKKKKVKFIDNLQDIVFNKVIDETKTVRKKLAIDLKLYTEVKRLLASDNFTEEVLENQDEAYFRPMRQATFIYSTGDW